MKIKKNVICWILMFSCIVSLCACSSKKDTDNNDSKKEDTWYVYDDQIYNKYSLELGMWLSLMIIGIILTSLTKIMCMNLIKVQHQMRCFITARNKDVTELFLV